MIDRLRSPAVVIALLLAYCLVHAAIGIVLTAPLEVDHVEQAIYAQSLEWHYGVRQPPLYTWMQYGWQRVVGSGQFSYVSLKYVLVALFLVFYYLAARRLCRDPRVAAAAGFAPLLLSQVGWKFHFGVTHTLLLSCACAGSLWALARLTSGARTRDWLLLGLMLGIGFETKWGFAAFAFALLAAMAWEPTTRARLSRSGLTLTALVAAILAAPLAVMVLDNQAALAELYSATLTSAPNAIGSGLTEGFSSLALATLAFLAPLWLVLLALFPLALWPTAPAMVDPTGAAEPADWQLYFRRFHLIIALILVALVVFGEAVRFKERWMHPFLLAVPLWWFVAIDRWTTLRAGRIEHRLRWYFGALVAVTAIVGGYRVALDLVGPPLCDKCRALAPYPELVRAVAASGFVDGTIIAGDEHIGGNLRAAFPRARIRSWPYPYYRAPLRGRAGQCLVVWKAREGPDVPARLDDILRQERISRAALPGARPLLQISLQQWRERWPAWGGADADPATPAYAWNYVLSDTPIGDCGR